MRPDRSASPRSRARSPEAGRYGRRWSAREAVAQTQKLEAVGRLTGGTAPDFDNLLTVIRASAEPLRLPRLSPEKRERYVDAVAQTADRAAALTSQLLAFARREPLIPEVLRAEERVAARRRAPTQFRKDVGGRKGSAKEAIPRKRQCEGGDGSGATRSEVVSCPVGTWQEGREGGY